MRRRNRGDAAHIVDSDRGVWRFMAELSNGCGDGDCWCKRSRTKLKHLKC